MRNRFKWYNYCLIPMVGVLNILISYVEMYFISSLNTIMASIIVLINSIVCYGFISFVLLRDEFREKELGKPHLRPLVKGILVAVCTIGICYMFQNMVFNAAYALNGFIPEEYLDLVSDVKYGKESHLFLEMLFLCFSFGIIAPIYEELFFRKILLARFREVSLVLRLIMSNVCFILMHEDVELRIFVIPLSIICSLVVIKGNVWVAMLTHCAVNLVGILKIPIGENFFSVAYPIKHNDPRTAMTSAFFCCVICLVLFWFICWLLFDDKKEKSTNREKWGIAIRGKENIYYFVSCLLFIVLAFFIPMA